jgi:tetratricopeptide (TPR) repeat protein
MKHFLLLLTMVVVTAFPAYAADDAVARAMKLYEKRHYEEAAAGLRAELPSLDPARQGAAHLTLGMLYGKSAELYRILHQESLAVGQDYLKKLSAGQGKGRSRFVDLYMGQALIEAGKPGAAALYIEKFAADETLDPLSRAIAKVDLGLCYYLSDDKQKADTIWKSINSTDPEVMTELGMAYSRAGLTEKNPEALCDQALQDIKKSGKMPSMRMVKNILLVYAKTGQTNKGFELLKRADTKAYSYREVLGKSKIINFYDLSLLGDLSVLYGQLSIASLEKAAGDAGVKDAAEYYLAEAYARSGSLEQSAKAASSFVTTSRMPQQYKDRMRLLQAENEFRKGQQAKAVTVWNEFFQKQPLDPDLLAEVILSCSRVKADCSQIVKRAEAVSETGQGKKFYSVNAAIGKYYLVKNNQAKAITYLEAGRDKSNKNKIESNDLPMLIDLAGVYYRTKKFSEALEIYFEMSKQFPAVRQIQETMQGVYAMEQKSAGDVKIF